MTGKLNQYILRNYFISLSFFTFALAGMFWLGQAVVLIDEVVLRGEGASTFFVLAFRLLPAIFLNVTPVAALGATLYFLNSIGTQGELVVLNSVGLNPLSVMKPILFVGLILAVFLYFMSLFLAPKANYDLRVTLRDIEANFSNNVVLSSRFVFPVDRVTIFANKSLNSGEMIDLFIEDRREAGVVRSYFADRGLLKRDGNVIQLALINGEFHEHNLENNDISRAHFNRTELNLVTEMDSPNSLSYWINEKPTSLLVSEVEAGVNENSKSLGELINRLFYPLLGIILPGLAGFIFVSAPYSRHGYSRALIVGASLGLGVTALQMSIPGTVEGNASFAPLAFLPLVIFLVVYLISRRRVR